MTIWNRELWHFPSFKETTPDLWGSKFCYFSLTALPVSYKALARKQNTPSSVPSKHVSSASVTPVLGQRHRLNNSYTWKEEMCGFSNPISQWNQQNSSSASVLQLHRGLYCLTAPALQSPCSRFLVILFIRISVFHSCMSLLHWCSSKWPKATGFTTDTRSGATTQNKASS